MLLGRPVEVTLYSSDTLRRRLPDPADSMAAFVVETARFLAELRGVSVEELGRTTSENFARLFGVGPA